MLPELMTSPTPMKNRLPLLALLLAALAASGCASAGAFNAANVTDVQLREANYELVATDVTGEASAGYLIGARWGVCRLAISTAFIRPRARARRSAPSLTGTFHS